MVAGSNSNMKSVHTPCAKGNINYIYFEIQKLNDHQRDIENGRFRVPDNNRQVDSSIAHKLWVYILIDPSTIVHRKNLPPFTHHPPCAAFTQDIKIVNTLGIHEANQIRKIRLFFRSFEFSTFLASSVFCGFSKRNVFFL